MSEDKEVTRRWVLVGIGVLLNGAVALLIATPIIGYLLGPVRKNGGYDSWIDLGEVGQFPIGETRLAGNTMATGAVGCVHLCSSRRISSRGGVVGRRARSFGSPWLIPCSAHPFHQRVYLLIGQASPGADSKGGHQRARRTIGDHLMQHLLIDQRLVFRIGQWIRWAVHSPGAVASGAVFAVESSKVCYRIRARHLGPGLGTAGKLFAAENN